MTTGAVSAFGTLLKLGDGGGSETFTTIAEVMDIGGPKLSADTKEVTNHSSGGWEEVIATIKRSGQVTFSINFIPSNATHSYSAGLLKDYNNLTRRNFQLVFPTSPTVTWAFAAYVTGFETSEPVNGQLSASLTLKITGTPTLA